MVANTPWPEQKRLRIGRHSEAGRAYLLTTVTAGRLCLFREWTAGCCMSRILAQPDTWRDARLLCWVLMPDHWHGMVSLDEGASLSQVMNRAKGRSAFAFNRMMDRSGRVWAPAFHDHAIRRDECLRSVARYVIANPIRAGLVATVGDYPFWDATWLTGDTIL